MATLKVIDTSGKKLTSMNVADDLVTGKVNPNLLAQAVRVYQSNQRQGGHRTKTRSEIAYSGGKLWRQKGTGNARHGSRRAPIFVGGGKAHGPTGQENYKMRLSNKMRKQAIVQAIRHKHDEGSIIVVDGIQKLEPKTKQVNEALLKTCDYPKTRKVLMILESSDQAIIRGIGNLDGVAATQAARINVFEILNSDKILISKEAVKILEKRVDNTQAVKTVETKKSEKIDVKTSKKKVKTS